MSELCRSCGKPFLPAYGLNGTCGLFLTGGPVEELHAEIASLKQRLESAEEVMREIVSRCPAGTAAVTIARTFLQEQEKQNG